jgi:hypothetical protein
VRVVLTWSEVAIAARIGEARTIRNRAKGREHRHNHPQPGAADWTTDIEAACAEVAAAKGLGVYMPIATTPDEDRLGDLGYGIHVRHSERDDARLILHPDDQDDGYYVLVTGLAPTYCLPGFIRGDEGKVERYWCDPTGKKRPAFFVPQNELHPIEGLVALRPLQLPPEWKTAYERTS